MGAWTFQSTEMDEGVDWKVHAPKLLTKEVLELFRDWGCGHEGFGGVGDGELDLVGVEVEAFGLGGLLKLSIEGEVAVVAVSDDGVAMEGGLDAKLVSAAGFGDEFEEGEGEGGSCGLESLEGGAGGEACAAFGDAEFVVFAAPFEAVFPVAFGGGGDAFDDGQVFFLHLLVAKEFVEGFGDL